MRRLATNSMGSTDANRATATSHIALTVRMLTHHIDRVVLAFVIFILFITTVDPTLGRRTVAYVVAELGSLAPWFTLSVLFAATAKATSADQIITRAFIGREGWVIPICAIVGGLTPFCSCGVTPLVASLLGSGVPLAPVMAFWIASPLMDPTQFFVIAGSLGLGFAVAKTVAAVGMGMLGGYGTMALTRGGFLSIDDALRISVRPKSGRQSSCSRLAPQTVWRFWEDGECSRVFLITTATTAWFLVRWLALAFAMESVMTAWLPPTVIAHWLGATPFAIPLAVLIGLPVYINGLAAIPFVAGLIQLGMSPAAALAFMLATTATGFAVLMTLWALVRPKVFALYIAFAIVGALLAGYTFDLVLAVI
jgi:uncharacterized protein